MAWEVKYANSGIRLTNWMVQTEVERFNAGADYGILVIKPRLLGVVNVHRWIACMRAPDHDSLIQLADARVKIGRPFHFTAASLTLQLAAVKAERSEVLAPQQFSAATAAPPGTKGDPSAHVRAMYLDDMVALVRLAKYGQ